MLKKAHSKKGFTLVEIITVVAIIGILAVVAMASYVRAQNISRKNVCIANLKQLQMIINVWALDTGAGTETIITKETLVPKYIKVWPKEGGVEYPVPENINILPACPNIGSNPDHKLYPESKENT